MKYMLRRGLIYTIAFMLLMPTWAISGLLRPERAHAAANITLSGGGSDTTINGTGNYFPLTTLNLTANIDGAFPVGGVDIDVTNDFAPVVFDTVSQSVTATPSANLNLGAGSGTAVKVTPTSFFIHIPISVAGKMGDTIAVSGIRVRALFATTPGIGSESLEISAEKSTDVIPVDVKPLALTGADTSDYNHNGKIDALDLTFSKNIADATLKSSDYSVTGYTVSGIDSGIANDDKAILRLQEDRDFDTDALPIIGSIASPSLTDQSGNALISITGFVSDKAAPVLVYGRTVDSSTIDLTFSETITHLDGTFGVVGYTVASFAQTGLNVVRLHLSGDMTPDERPVVTYSGDSAHYVGDGAGNIVTAAGPITVADGVDPVVDPGVVLVEYAEGSGALPEHLVVSFSEGLAKSGNNGDYEVSYDPTGTFADLTKVRTIDIMSQPAPVLASDDASKVLITIADQSAQTDFGGKFRVTVKTPGDVTDLGGNPVDADRASLDSNTVAKFDTVLPVLSTVTIVSSGSDKKKATIGDTVTLTFASSKTIQTPVVTINGKSASVTGSGQNFTASRVMTTDDAAGLVTFEIKIADLSGNNAVVTTVSDSSSVTFAKQLVTPVATVTKVEENGSKVLRVQWQGVDNGVEKYYVIVNGVISAVITVTGDDAGKNYSSDIKVLYSGKYDVYVRAVRGSESAVSGTKSIEFASAASTQAPAKKVPVTSVAPGSTSAQTNQPTVEAPATPAPETPSTGDEGGKIKGDEENKTEKINWTPWIILFVLILLTGAATGGYFYWFGGEEEVKTSVREPKAEAPKAEKIEKEAPKKSAKRSKRW